ncbi:MAG: hypothetical protein EZS28_004967 [Streblomastix strix]|uniref:Protein kinase domain-containing protein n=1 Tax=Streblomastix strix TaxID=222440 RepID=A0A5J4WZ80_9EUKA|nr:MAG: hypothetical protein EZS28_004967 [Streblomastix strix]
MRRSVKQPILQLGNDNQAFVEDKSTNGTFLNSFKIGKGNKRNLNDGDVIELTNSQKQTLYMIGSGSFSHVEQVWDKVEGQQYAAKIIQMKGQSEQDDDKSNMMIQQQSREFDIIMQYIGNHHNVIHMIQRLIGEKYTYIIMEYANCGDLLDLCNLLGSVPSVSEDDTNISDNESKKEQDLDYIKKLFISEPSEHNSDYVFNNEQHDEVSPELIPFIGMESQTLCGTPDYISPELLSMNSKENKIEEEQSEEDILKQDVWSLGILLYYMFFGHTAKNQVVQIHNITQLISGHIPQSECDIPYWLRGITYDAVRLLGRMLTPSPSDRISSAQALDHEWFNSLKEKVQIQ